MSHDHAVTAVPSPLPSVPLSFAPPVLGRLAPARLDAAPRTPATPCMKSSSKKRHRTPSSPQSDPNSNPNSNSNSNSDSNGATSAAKKAPARICAANNTLSVRKQLALVRQLSALRASEHRRPPERTSFRRSKEDSAVRRTRLARDALPDGKYDYDAQPLMYVDGYNVIGVWPRLRKHRNADRLSRARALLLESVAEFAAVRGWQCVLVFDAMHATHIPDPAHATAGEDFLDAPDVDVVFTASETADAYIERSVFEGCRLGQRQIWATTSDLVQAKVSGAMGAHIMSASLFIQELKQVKTETHELIKSHNCVAETNRSNMLMSNVDSETLKKLYKLRDGDAHDST